MDTIQMYLQGSLYHRSWDKHRVPRSEFCLMTDTSYSPGIRWMFSLSWSETQYSYHWFFFRLHRSMEFHELVDYSAILVTTKVQQGPHRFQSHSHDLAPCICGEFLKFYLNISPHCPKWSEIAVDHKYILQL